MSSLKSFRISVISSMFALLFFVSTYSVSFAADYETPHTFEPGDVVSANMMNEVFNYIKDAKNTITASALVGTWSCDAFAAHDANCTNDSGPVAGWNLGSAGLYRKLSNATITFTNNGDGTFSMLTSAPNPFVCSVPYSMDTKFEMIGDIMYYHYATMANWPNLTLVGLYTVSKVDETRLYLVYQDGSSYNPISIICDKQNLPPNSPTDLSATASTLTVSLSWTDNSSDETGFKIFRKDTLTGAFSQIATTAANVNSYEDTLSSVGSYWYRVKATNANGDSLGSNEVKVVLAD